MEGAAGPSRQPPETQRAGCVWVALSPPLSNAMASSSFGFLLTFPTLSCPCLSHGLTQRAGRVSLPVGGFVTQAQSGSNLPPSQSRPGQEFLQGGSSCDTISQAGVAVPPHPPPHALPRPSKRTLCHL